MPLKLKISKKGYSNEMVEIILAFYKVGRLQAQITNQVKVFQLFVVHIIHQANCTQNKSYCLIKQASNLFKLDTQA